MSILNWQNVTKMRKCNMTVKRDGTVADYITQAFLMLLQKKSFHDIKINEICEKAGVTRKTAFHKDNNKYTYLHNRLREK